MKHLGFKGAQKSIEAKEGMSAKAAGRILGVGAKKASAKAKKRNPRLNRVTAAQKGDPKKTGYRPLAERMLDDGDGDESKY